MASVEGVASALMMADNTKGLDPMKIYLVSIEWCSCSMVELHAFSSKDKADAFLAWIARKQADERDEDFEPGEWRAYLNELHENSVLYFDEDENTLDGEG